MDRSGSGMALRLGVRLSRAVTEDSRPIGILIGGGALVAVLATTVAAAAPATGEWRLGIIAIAIGLFAAFARRPLAVSSTVVLAWLLVNGFLVDRFGELSWHGRADLYRAAALILAGAGGQVVGVLRLVRARIRDHERWSVFINECEEEKRGA
jgi:hypothetical protein